MRHIMVMNAKGGCGKSTLATNIACYYAMEGAKVALADYDPQRTSLDWTEIRPDDVAPVTGIAAFDDGLRSLPRVTDILVIDAPARTHGAEMNELVRRAETILVPVLPSPIDIKACGRFMEELLELGRVQRAQARLAVVANRVRENTVMFADLESYLGKLRIPYLGHLRQSANYLRAYQRGLGIFELPEYLAWPDWAQWDPVIGWLDSKRSQPA